MKTKNIWNRTKILKSHQISVEKRAKTQMNIAYPKEVKEVSMIKPSGVLSTIHAYNNEEVNVRVGDEVYLIPISHLLETKENKAVVYTLGELTPFANSNAKPTDKVKHTRVVIDCTHYSEYTYRERKGLIYILVREGKFSNTEESDDFFEVWSLANSERGSWCIYSVIKGVVVLVAEHDKFKALHASVEELKQFDTTKILERFREIGAISDETYRRCL